MTISKGWLWLGVLVLLLLFGASTKGAMYAKDQYAKLSHANDSLKKLSARVDTVYKQDTVVLWRLKHSTDTLTQTVEQWKHDTLRVVEYVAAADSTIKACSVVVLTCEQRVGIRDARISILEERNLAQAALIPSRWDYVKRDARTAVYTITIWQLGKLLLSR